MKTKKTSKKRTKTNKGKPFEREIATKISLWLTNGAHDDQVWHTGSSGARGTVRTKNLKSASKEIIGDLTATIEASPLVKKFFNCFSCELKTGYPKGKYKSKKTNITTVTNWSISDILDGKENTPTFFKFWGQAINDANKSKREALLIFRRNQKNPCIAMDFIFYKIVCNVIPKPRRVINAIIIQQRFGKPIAVCNLDDFIKLTKTKIDHVLNYLEK
jgi:hypothetical protein